MVLAEHYKGSTKDFIPLKKYRFPIRLGADVFSEGKISQKNLKESARTFKKFRQLSEKYDVKKIRAVGTSALREASNSKAFLELVKRKSEIAIEIIDGVEEARLIHLAVKREVGLENTRALLIDIGGGSVELTFSDNGLMESTQSFPFGTVRTLEMMKKKHLDESQLSLVISDFLKPLTNFLNSQVTNKKLEFAVGTGGNLEAIGKLKAQMLGSKSTTVVTAGELGEMIPRIQKLTYKERIDYLKMRADRADVIIPAALIVQTVMRQAGVEKLLIPHVGLKDGILMSLIEAEAKK